MFFDILLFPLPVSQEDEPNPTFSCNKYLETGDSNREEQELELCNQFQRVAQISETVFNRTTMDGTHDIDD